MRPFIRKFGVAFACTALVSGVGVGSAEALEVSSERPGTIDWKPCPEDSTAECGTLRLPIDWARPSGEKFDLAVARRKATDPSRRVGVLLINPGGPGDPGVNFALRANTYFSPDVQAKFDIIGFDPRGVGRSRPVKCSADVLQRQPSAYPRNQAEFDRIAAYNRELREDCRRLSGPIFDHADTLSGIHDMDAIRTSLGEQKISYFGHSYGTLIGEQYAERYGNRIRAMVTTANVDHSQQSAQQFLVSSAVGNEDLFNEFVKWCDRTTSCGLYGRDVTAVWDGLLARADRGEIHDLTHPERALTANEIALTAVKDFYGPDWSELAVHISQLDAQTQASASASPASASAEQTVSNPFAAVFCQDWQFRVKDYPELARLTAAEMRAAPHMRGAVRVHPALTGCIGWPDKANNPQHRLRITNAPKLLMLNSVHDPASVYSWAVNVHRQSRNATVLLTYEGWGHQVYKRSDCTRGAVDGYLTELKVPGDGTRCALVEPTAAPAAKSATIPAGPRTGIPG